MLYEPLPKVDNLEIKLERAHLGDRMFGILVPEGICFVRNLMPSVIGHIFV